MGFSRQEYWSGLPFPSVDDFPDPGIKPRFPALQADDLATELWGTPRCSQKNQINHTPRPHRKTNRKTQDCIGGRSVAKFTHMAVRRTHVLTGYLLEMSVLVTGAPIGLIPTWQRTSPQRGLWGESNWGRASKKKRTVFCNVILEMTWFLQYGARIKSEASH